MVNKANYKVNTNDDIPSTDFEESGINLAQTNSVKNINAKFIKGLEKQIDTTRESQESASKRYQDPSLSQQKLTQAINKKTTINDDILSNSVTENIVKSLTKRIGPSRGHNNFSAMPRRDHSPKNLL